ncbi:glycoside hydrolase family 3 protein [Kribbella sandramycini]|uniref:beta-N-acetylhexosaminidase n=1 Tax=Kribbella sandramycini TaxID=60450 RepID=A0A7Y4L3T3_9ACTN|nr:glycoside hydrolase family 3 protein [Kribbella sandramycini]MBB6566414.1 beta-N-acetylhexosaminidase [Kribbella sandramycini]NOL42927.1 glycoside hydrolase family 3 protein [Kribbella sandramycini]
MKRTAVLALSLLLVTGCSDSSQPTAGPSTIPSSSVPKPTTQPTETPTPTPTPTATPTSCVDAKLKTLTLREQAAQLIMTGISANGMTSSQRPVIQKQKPGGVLLLGNSGSLAHTRAATNAASKAATVKGIKPLMAADQEGGEVQRLKGSGFTRIPAATVQGTWSSEKLTARAKLWAGQLMDAGVNVNLTPVADVVPANLKQRNAPIGSLNREFGNTPGEVGPAVQAFVKGMQAAGVITSVKHFPGIGRVRGNTDFSSGVVDTVTVRGDDDLQPFADGIAAGSEMLMVSTVTYTKIDPANRAVFSPTVIGGMVRGDLGYDGVVITDDVGAAAEVAKVPAGQRATRVIAAGGDIVINGAPGLNATMINALVAKAQQDDAFAAKLTASVRRVLALKEKHGLVAC